VTERRVPDVVVGAVVLEDDHLLMVKRANPPAAGTWSVPGGRVEWG
jgi:8-oxo-dGTP diphosphatase